MRERTRLAYEQPDTERFLVVDFYDIPYDPLPMDPILTLKNEIMYESLHFEEVLCDQENIQFGKTNSSVIKFTSKNFATDVLNKYMAVGLELRNTRLQIYETYGFGMYKVTSVKKSSDRKYKDISGVSAQEKLSIDVASWYNSLFTNRPSPIMLRDVLLDLMANGVQMEWTNYPIYLPNDSIWRFGCNKYITPTSLKARDVIEDILEIAGCFGRAWAHPLETFSIEKSSLFPSEDLYPLNTLYPRGGDREGGDLANTVGTYRSATYEDYQVKSINSVAIEDAQGNIIGVYDGEEITVGNQPVNRYTVRGNIFTIGLNTTEATALAEKLYSLYRHFEYTPYKAVVDGGLQYELGTQITVHGESGAFDSYVLKRQVDGIVGHLTTLEAIGTEYIQEGDIPFQTKFELEQQKTQSQFDDISRGVNVSVDENNNPSVILGVDAFVDKDLDVGRDLLVVRNVHIAGDLQVDGYKHRLVHTPHYGDRLLSAYETPCPMFGDTGHGKIGKDGKCYIYHDVVFLETINTKQDYQVFLQSYSENPVWISEKTEEYFVVSGTPDCEFDWEMKAKQRDYEIARLEESIPIAKESKDE